MPVVVLKVVVAVVIGVDLKSEGSNVLAGGDVRNLVDRSIDSSWFVVVVSSCNDRFLEVGSKRAACFD